MRSFCFYSYICIDWTSVKCPERAATDIAVGTAYRKMYNTDMPCMGKTQTIIRILSNIYHGNTRGFVLHIAC